MTDAVRGLRWQAGLAALFFGVGVAVAVTLLVTGGHTPRTVAVPLAGGIALVVAAIVQAARGMIEPDPDTAVRRLRLSMALVAGADVLMLGGNALIRMAAG